MNLRYINGNVKEEVGYRELRKKIWIKVRNLGVFSF